LAGGVAASTNSFESIATVSPAGLSSVTFSSIPSTFKHLQIRQSVLLSAGNNIKMQFNGDTSSNYSWHQLAGSGSAASAAGAANTGFMYAGYWAGTANAPEAGIIDVLEYANTNTNKTVRILEGNDINGAGGYIIFWSGNWRSTSAVSSITFFPTSGQFDTNTKIALYGIKG
jgi:hypothetical protein